jgi:putative thiamine transport system substrate-binding protein
MTLKSLIAAAALTLAPLTVSGAAIAQDWQETVAEAEGGQVYWNAWGGGEAINAYIAWVGDRLEEDHDIELVHVKLGDTAEAVRKVVAEKAAGRDSGGSVDLIWINGENFKAMKDQGLLHGPFVDRLPNVALTNALTDPSLMLDFTIPTEGLEAPWGRAKLVFIHDTETVAEPPSSMMDLLAHAKANPGRVTYPAPPDFLGSTFMKQALHELVADPEALLLPAGDNFDAVTAPLWAFLDELHPVLWRDGGNFPENEDALIRLLDEGAVDFAISFQPGKASSAIAQGLLPETARTFVFADGTIGNTHYVAIPYNAANRAAALVLANFLMSPEAQARKQDPEVWGDMTVLDMNKLTEADRALFEALPRGVATLPVEDLGATLPEPHPSWMTMTEAAWLERYGS